MQQQMNLSRRWLLAAACLPLLTLAGLSAGELPAPPGPAPENQPAALTKADFLPVLELRLNQIGASVAGLKSYLDAGFPMGSLQALYYLKTYLLRSLKLEGVDTTKSAHILAFVPKAILTAKPEDFPALQQQATVAQLVPVKDEKAYLDQLEDDVDEIKDQGAYKLVTVKDLPMPLYLKIVKGWAVFAPSTLGVELGLAQVDAVVAADAASKEGPAVVLEVRPHGLMVTSGLTTDEKRQAAVAALSEWLANSRDMNQFVQGLLGSDAAGKPLGAKAAADQLLAGGAQCESAQLYLSIDKAQCSLGTRVQAVAGSDLSKMLAGMKPLDPKSVCGLAHSVAIVDLAGSLDPVVMAWLANLHRRMDPATQAKWDPLLQALKDLPGHSFSYAVGLDKKDSLTLGAELDFSPDTDLAKVVKSLEASLRTAADGLKAKGEIYLELASNPGADQDGWQVTEWTVTLKADDPQLKQLLLEPSMNLFPNPQHLCLLSKGSRLVVGSGHDAAAAAALAGDYAAQKDNTRMNPDFAARIAANCKDRGASGVMLFNLYPMMKLVMQQNGAPPMAVAAANGMAELDPLMLTEFCKDNAVQVELLMAPGGIQQWAVISAIAIPNLLASKVATNETAAVQNLKALATAQAQYIKKNDFYTASASDLNASGTLIAADYKNAFEQFQKNGDQATPSPKAGYVFRMLQGDAADGLQSFNKDPNDPKAGMNTWAAIARAVEPGTTGENQYFISEAGTVYKHAEPLDATDPNYKKFLLDHALSPDELEKQGWTPAH